MINAFGVWDAETIEYISKWLGQTTVRNFNYSVQKSQTPDGFADVSYSAQDKAVTLLRPEEIRTMSADEQLIFYRNVPPIRAQKVHYYKNPQWEEWAQPNPYRR